MCGIAKGAVEDFGESLLGDSKSPEALKPTVHQLLHSGHRNASPLLRQGSISSVAPFPFPHFLCLCLTNFLFVRKHVKARGKEAACRALFRLNPLEWIPVEVRCGECESPSISQHCSCVFGRQNSQFCPHPLSTQSFVVVVVFSPRH